MNKMWMTVPADTRKFILCQNPRNRFLNASRQNARENRFSPKFLRNRYFLQ